MCCCSNFWFFHQLKFVLAEFCFATLCNLLKKHMNSHPTLIWFLKTVLQIRAGQRSITASLQSLTTHIYHVMIIATSSFSKKSFFCCWYYFYILEILLSNLELLFLKFKHIYKTQKTGLFSFYLFIFTCCFVIILCTNILHIFVLIHCVFKHTGWVFFFCLFINHSM